MTDNAQVVFRYAWSVWFISSAIISSKFILKKYFIHVWYAVQQVILGLFTFWRFPVGYVQNADIPAVTEDISIPILKLSREEAGSFLGSARLQKAERAPTLEGIPVAPDESVLQSRRTHSPGYSAACIRRDVRTGRLYYGRQLDGCKALT